MSVRSIEEARAYLKQERAKDNAELWEAIVAIHEAIAALGGAGLPERNLGQARANLIRAGITSTGDFTDAELAAMATADGVRVWSADMGMIFKDEAIIGADGETYIALQQHQAQSGWAPGTEGGRTLFRLLRSEPEKEGVYLDFAWGEHVPYGAVRRDPVDGNLYTPIHESGVTLYEPHYPHLVPSEYKLYTPDEKEDPADQDEPDTSDEPVSAVPAWDDLEANHLFAVGDHFTCDGAEYEVLREFTKQDNWKPPALTGNFYEAV